MYKLFNLSSQHSIGIQMSLSLRHYESKCHFFGDKMDRSYEFFDYQNGRFHVFADIMYSKQIVADFQGT